MVEGVVVAAGFSSRAGSWKMALDLGGISLIEHCILGMVPWCARIIVVGGNRFNLLQDLLPKQKYPTVDLIYNPDFEKGMFSSVLTGFGQVHAAQCFFTPGDYPLVSRTVYEMLLNQAGEIIIPCYQGVNGHPVLFRTEVIKDLLHNPTNYTTLRAFVLEHHPHIVEVTDPGILMDIDTPEDYRRVVRYFNFKQ